MDGRPRISQTTWDVLTLEWPQQSSRIGAVSKEKREDNNCGSASPFYLSSTGVRRWPALPDQWLGWRDLNGSCWWWRAPERLAVHASVLSLQICYGPQSATSSECYNRRALVKVYGTAMPEGKYRWLKAYISWTPKLLDGLLRVRGKLNNSHQSFEAKQSVILLAGHYPVFSAVHVNFISFTAPLKLGTK